MRDVLRRLIRTIVMIRLVRSFGIALSDVYTYSACDCDKPEEKNVCVEVTLSTHTSFAIYELLMYGKFST